MNSRIVLTLLVASLVTLPAAQAGQQYGIGQVAAARSFATPKAFSDAVDCVRAGDRIALEAGRRHVGMLQLRVCPDSGEGIVEVVSARAGASAALDGSRSAADLGLQWTEVPARPGAAASAIKLLSLGPLPGSVTQVMGPDGPLPPAAWPNASGRAAPALARIATVRKQGDACAAWLCVVPGAADWTALAASLAAPTDDQRPTVVLRNSPWSYTRHEVAAIDPRSGTLGLMQARGSSGVAEDKDFVQPGTGMVLYGGLATLDVAGEWWYDDRRQTVIVALERARAGEVASLLRVSMHEGTGGAPALVSLQPRGRQAVPAVSLRVRDLELTAAAGSAVSANGIGTLEMLGVTVRHPTEHGVAVSGIRRLVVRESQIVGTGNNGILATDVRDVVIERNRILEAGRLGVQPQLTTQFNGIRASGFTRAALHDNEIRGIGYAGIMLAERGAFAPAAGLLPGLAVGGNVIGDFCRMLNDCGAIYVNGGQRGQKPTVDDGVRKQVVGNRIADPRPSMAGLPGDGGAASPSGDKSGAWVRMVGAVYLDHGASGYDIRDNKVEGSYTPFGWAVFNGGVDNACNREAVTQCKAGPRPYRCYTDGLSSCNTAPPKPAR